MVFSTFSTFSLQSLKNQLSDKAYSKLLKFEILALACVLGTEIDTFTKIVRVWVQSAWTEKSCLSNMDYREQHEIAVNSMDINNPWSLSLWFIQNRNHITSGTRQILSYTKSGQPRATKSPENITFEKPISTSTVTWLISQTAKH